MCDRPTHTVEVPAAFRATPLGLLLFEAASWCIEAAVRADDARRNEIDDHSRVQAAIHAAMQALERADAELPL